MSFTEDQVVEHIESLTVTRLRTWVSSGWVRPGRREEALRFTDSDIARLRLICDLHDVLELDEEALPLVLSLIDQVHGLRHELRTLARAVETQPEDVREQIKQAYHELLES